MRAVSIMMSLFLLTVSWEDTFANQFPHSCSVHPKRGASAANLATLATVRQADAEKTALESLHTSSPTTVTEGELEVEHRCLVYSFDIRVSGKDGVEEVLIDAGTGKVLSHEHESSRQEQTEKVEKKQASPRH